VSSEIRRVALVVPVVAAEPLVSGWRKRFDVSAVQGMPAHVTALYPFLPEEQVTDAVPAELRELCAAVPALDVVFRRIGRFPGVVYLEPEPADGLRQLTMAIARRWPATPPYGGRFDDVVPHLTVAQGASEDEVTRIEADLSRGLPFEARLVETYAYRFDGTRWQLWARLPFEARGNES
jgi:2'-5' RNA ligase